MSGSDWRWAPNVPVHPWCGWLCFVSTWVSGWRWSSHFCQSLGARFTARNKFWNLFWLHMSGCKSDPELNTYYYCIYILLIVVHTTWLKVRHVFVPPASSGPSLLLRRLYEVLSFCLGHCGPVEMCWGFDECLCKAFFSGNRQKIVGAWLQSLDHPCYGWVPYWFLDFISDLFGPVQNGVYVYSCVECKEHKVSDWK